MAAKRLSIVMLPALAVQVAAQSHSISFPSSPPSNAVTVPADFVGLGFDGAFLDTYDNQFSYNLVSSLTSHMSVPPIIRIGGTSADRLKYNPNQQQQTVCISGPCPYGSGATFSVGPSYFDGFKAFPNNPMTFQAPMARNLNVSGSLDIVKGAYAALGANRTAAIALGNEVNFYEANNQDYVDAAHTLQAAIVQALGLTGKGQKIFEVLDLASGSIGPDSPVTVQGAFKDGLNNNSLTLLAASHWYQVMDDAGSTLQADLMNHTAITQKFTNYEKELSYLQKNNPNIPLALTETGSVLGNASFAAVFGAALWAVDFKLYSMSQGIARVDGSQRPQAPHSLWVPVSGVTGSPGPQVRAPFYSEVFVADFIGKTGGTTKVVGMDLNSDFLTAYGAYESGNLARIALTNLHEWNNGDGTRPNVTFAVQLPAGITKVQAANFAADAGALAGGYDVDGEPILYKGQQWSYKLGNGNPTGTATLQNVPVSGGVATLQLPDSQAVILHLS